MADKIALLIEDTQRDQDRIRSILSARSIESEIVNSVLEARQKLKEKDYLFVILDLDLGSGTDEGLFFLDIMLQEDIQKPTVIISHSAMQPQVQALKARYTFIEAFIDKTNLYIMLDLFDKTLQDIFEFSGIDVGKAQGYKAKESNYEIEKKSTSVVFNAPVQGGVQVGGHNNVQTFSIVPNQDFYNAISKVLEIVKTSPLSVLDQEDATEALQRVSKLANMEQSEDIITRAKSKLDLVKTMLEVSTNLSTIAMPYLQYLYNWFQH